MLREGLTVAEDRRVETVRSADGTCIAFRRRGSGPPLLFVHGALSDQTIWDGVASRLRARRATYAIDRRGRGASGDAPSYAVEREVEDIFAVARAAKGPVDLFGHSSGAILCLMAAEEGIAVRRLILYEPPIFSERPETPSERMERTAALVARGDGEAAALSFLRERAELPEPEVARLRSSGRWPALVAIAHTLVYDTRIGAEYRLDPGRRERLAALDVPTLLLLGGESAPRYGAGLDQLATLLPESRLALLPGQRHNAMFTAPKLLAREIEVFLAEAAPS